MFKLDIPLDKIKPKHTDDNSKFITIDKMQVHYKDDGKGKALVLLHDAGTSLKIWDSWMPFLSEHFRIIRLDLPGFGLTPKSNRFNYQMDSYIYFIKKFTTALGLGLETFNIGGVGFGGHLAWQYTLLHQHKVEKLLLINAQGYATQSSLSLFQFDKKSSFGRFMLRWRGTQRMVDKQLKKVLGNPSIVDSQLVEETQELLLCKGNRQSLVTLASIELKDRRKRLSEIQTPTLIQWGSKAEKVKFEKDLPNSKYHVYKGVGLFPMIEQPEQTAKDVLSFLA